MEEINDLIAQRRQKLIDLKDENINPYPNNFRPDTLVDEIFEKYADQDKEQLTSVTETFALAGRLMTKRVMGKASFVHISDRRKSVV